MEPSVMLRRQIDMRTLVGVGVLTIATLVGGCGSTRVAAEPTVHASEMDAHDGEACPRQLPIGEDPSGHGFGMEDEADELPSLLAPEQAWVCRYDAVEAGHTANGGTTFEWVRGARVRDVDESTIRHLESALGRLGLFGGERTCTADLGPRWMIVYAHGGDLTGVVVDDYGCREVRLTSEPFTTPAGTSHKDGTVDGTLDGGANLLEQLGLRRSS
jgi:hypothetical protein